MNDNNKDIWEALAAIALVALYLWLMLLEDVV